MADKKVLGWANHPHGKAEKRPNTLLLRIFTDPADEKHYIDLPVPFFEFKSTGIGYGAYGQRLEWGGHKYRLGLTITDPDTIPEEVKEARKAERAIGDVMKLKPQYRKAALAEMGLTEAVTAAK